MEKAPILTQAAIDCQAEGGRMGGGKGGVDFWSNIDVAGY